MNADYVTLDSGTGLVHVAPGHGEDDYFASRKYKLPVLSPIDNRGYYTDEAPGLEGLFYDEGNKVVSKWLEEKDALLKLEFFTHSYPHDWRTKNQSFSVPHRNGLLQSMTSVKIFWMKLKK